MNGNSVSDSVFSANPYDDKGGWGLPHFLLDGFQQTRCLRFHSKQRGWFPPSTRLGLDKFANKEQIRKKGKT